MPDANVYGLTHAGDWVGLVVDDEGHPVCVPYAEHLEHRGRAFVAPYLWESLGAGLTDYFVLISDSNLHVRAGFAITASGLITARLYEGTSFTGGTAVTVMGVNRAEASVVHGCRAYHGIVPMSFGTELLRDFVPASQLLALGGAEQELPRWHLQMGIPYCIQITNTTGAGIYASILASIFVEEG